MAKTTSMLINIVLLHTFSHCQNERSPNTKWFRDKHSKVISQPLSMNERVNNAEIDQTYETDIYMKNIALTINNTNYEKYLKFWAFGSHFKIYLKKQLLFHPEMTIIHEDGIEANVEIPVFYAGFSYGSSLSTAHGRFYNNNFKGIINWKNNIIIIECPHARLSHSHFKMFSCTVILKMNVFEVNNTDSWNDYYHEERNYKKFLSKSLPHDTRYTENKKIHSRHKRAVSVPRSCHLHLVADHLYFKYVGSLNIGTTVETIMTNIAQADTIFRSTDFNGDGYGDNIGFVVANITIYNHPFVPGYKLHSEDLDVYEYLNRFSEYDFGGYCLGVAFTYRDFEKGIVGLAWVGSSSPVGRSGGICDASIYDTGSKVFSYNTLLLSQLNAGEFYPTYRAALALTHEMGHSFGSAHDEVGDKTCAPNDEYGNFIMYPFVITGKKPNNKKFSPCSINTINPVIVKKGSCLKKDIGPVCGNGIREEGEQCDCGTIGTCRYIDPCCTPSDMDNMVDEPCTFASGKMCSPKESPCCSKHCMPISLNASQICNLRTECSLESYCDGKNASCPAPVAVPDGKSCNGGRMRCEAGKCTTTVCEWLKLKDCQCVDDPKLHCHICCMPENASQSECAPIGTFDVASDDLKNLRSQHGQPCNGNQGFCDENDECIMASIDSINMRMQNFFSSGFHEDIVVWFKTYWSFLFAAVAIMLTFMALFFITYKKHHDSHVEALRVARLTTALEEAIHQKHVYYKKIKQCKDEIDKKILQIKLGKQLDSAEAVARLTTLFPTAPLLLIIETMKFSPNEEAAVRLLLIRGFPMRTFNVSIPSHNIISKKTLN